jgi:hypothetical protein
MPLVAVQAHQLLQSAAALRLALDTLADERVPASKRGDLIAIAQRHVALLEDGLRELILLPRD